MPKISVIIPTWCREDEVSQAVKRGLSVGDEVIIADAGSPDATIARAEAAGAHKVVVTDERNRGRQLDAGARAATGDVLLFLPCSVHLTFAARAALLEALRSPRVLGGNFRLAVDDPSLASRVFTQVYDMRRRVFGVYYADSVIFVRRAVYRYLGGFKHLPVMADADFARRLERTGSTVQIRATPAVHECGFEPLKSLALRSAIHGLYLAGVPPTALARIYDTVA